MATSAKLSWSDKAVSLLLDLLHTRESLWNTKQESYKDHNIKKREYAEMLDGLREDVPGLKGKFLVDRSFESDRWFLSAVMK